MRHVQELPGRIPWHHQKLRKPDFDGPVRHKSPGEGLQRRERRRLLYLSLFRFHEGDRGKMRDRGKAHRCQKGPRWKEKGQERKPEKDVREIPLHRDEGEGGDDQEGHGQQRQRRFDAEGRRLFLDCVHDEDGARGDAQGIQGKGRDREMLPHREKRKRPEQDVRAERQRAVRQAPHGLHHCGAEGRVHLPHERAFPQKREPERPEDAHGTRQDHHVQG